MKKIRAFIEKQGFFMMLALCVLIIVGSGIWALRAKDADPGVEADQLPRFVQTLDQAERLRLYAPVSGEIVSRYETITYLPTLNRWGAHEGVDFRAEKGEDIFAAQAGTVTAAFRDAQWGGVIVITHSGGFETKYCGLAWPPGKETGSRVEALERIGAVGTIPIESGDFSHFHFEMWIDGKPADPALYL